MSAQLLFILISVLLVKATFWPYEVKQSVQETEYSTIFLPLICSFSKWLKAIKVINNVLFLTQTYYFAS